MPLEIRTAVPGDAAAVAPLLADLGYPQQVDELAERIAQRADTQTDVVLLAELDGRIIGVACLHVTVFLHLPGAGRARLTALVVHPAYRDAGIGGRLLREAERAAEQRDCIALEPDQRRTPGGRAPFLPRRRIRGRTAPVHQALPTLTETRPSADPVVAVGRARRLSTCGAEKAQTGPTSAAHIR